MKFRSTKPFVPTLVFPILLLWAAVASPLFGEEASKTTDHFDVVLLVDGSPPMAAMSRKSAVVAAEAMGDRHRLGIITFGKTATVLQPLAKIATVAEKNAALETLVHAPFKESHVDLSTGLNAALAMLTEGPKAGAKKVIVLLAGAPSSFADKADMENFKKTLPPLLLQQNVLLFVVAMPTANVKLLELTAGLTGGKCLAALDLETMTDALDSIVNELQPPKEIVVEKQVPIKTVINQIQEMTPDERLARNREASFQLMIFVTVATTITVLLLFSIGLQWVLYRRMRPEKKSVRKDGNAAQKEKSSFAELRDLALALNNSVVDTGEMMEQLNLDLEDFGVEKWRREKQLEKRFSELALSLVLLLDHLRIQSDEVGAAADDRLRQRIERLLEDAKIHEIPVLPEDEFDGDLHKAVESVDSTLAGGRIVRVLRKGYQVGDSDKDAEALVLRQAEVAVSNNAAQKDTKGNKDV